jgi:hypothetical protein
MNLMQKDNAQKNHRITCASIFVLIILIFLWRVPTRLIDGFLWAEDITVFLKDAYEIGVQSITIPHAGYLLLLPRIIAYLQTLSGSPFNAPYFYAWSSVIISSIGSVYIFHVTMRYTRNFILSVLAAFAPVYVAQSGEVFSNITNLQWFMAPVLLLILFDLIMLPQRFSTVIVAKTMVLLILALTGPFSIMFMPVAFVMVARNWKCAISPKIISPVIVFFSCVIIQARVVAQSLSASSALKHHLWFDRFLSDYSAQIFLSRPIISRMEGAHVFWVLPALILISIFACGRKSLPSLVLFSYSVGLWVAGVMRVNNPGIMMGPLGAGARYYFVPYILLAWAIILCIKNSAHTLKIIPYFLLACILFAGVSGFNADVHEAWSINQTKSGVYEIKAPPGWYTTVVVPENRIK